MLYIAIYWLRKKYGFLPFASKIWVNDGKWDGTKLTRHIVLETASLVGTTCLPKFAYGSRSDEHCVRRLFIEQIPWRRWFIGGDPMPNHPNPLYLNRLQREMFDFQVRGRTKDAPGRRPLFSQGLREKSKWRWTRRASRGPNSLVFGI